MRLGVRLLLLTCVAAATGQAFLGQAATIQSNLPEARAFFGPSASLPRSTPEAQGVHSAGILKFIEAADKTVDSIHSLMVVRHGKVIADAWWAPEAAEKPHILWSLTKSFTGTAVGLAIDEGKLSLDDRLVDIFPNDVPEDPSEHLEAMRVIDLLRMTAGHQEEMDMYELAQAPDLVKSFMSHPVPHKPGTHFRYNTPGSCVLAAIVQEVSGETVLDYLMPRLFAPLGIERPGWDSNSEGINFGGFGLYLKTEDLAKFGQLYLQRGMWHGEQIVPASWVDMATRKQTSNGSDPKSHWEQGYGFQFWMDLDGSYRGDGMYGQFCIILPKLDAVVVITSKTKDMRSEIELVWGELLPAFADGALEEAPFVLAKLRAKTSMLEAKK